MSLEIDRAELLELFPRKLEGLDVVITENSSNRLSAVYVQKDTYDERREWEAYNRWLNSSDEEEVMYGFPTSFDRIYEQNMENVRGGLISNDDKISMIWSDEGNSVARLDYIRRNMDPELRGLGKECYENMLVWLKEIGYRFVVLVPSNNKAKKFWNGNGLVAFPDGEEDGEAHFLDKFYPWLVHFLDKGDKKSFLAA